LEDFFHGKLARDPAGLRSAGSSPAGTCSAARTAGTTAPVGAPGPTVQASPHIDRYFASVVVM
jgi:hypothetical protein